MVTIRTATIDDITRIQTIGTATLLETYLASTPEKAVRAFAKEVFDRDTLFEELQSTHTIYHLVYQNDTLVGYSKIVLNASSEYIAETNITKLDRFYVLKKFHGQGYGNVLFEHFVAYSKTKQQQGIWLYVLIENERAVNFYTKHNFKVVAYHDFVVTPTHTNPNHVMFLKF